MGLFDILKKKKSEVLAIVPALTSDKTISERNNFVSNNSAIVVRPDKVPPDILKLLWFVDGQYKNYTNTAKHKSTINVQGLNIEISFMGASEPSVISVTLPIVQPKNPDDIERPQYYPSYSFISPEQRWIYLSWLKNVEAQVNIGYVFLFYYGLERHLFFGDAEAAFDMILRLRSSHKNGSFMSYSSSALVAASLFHKRADWFIKYINSINSVDEVAVDAIYLLAKQAMGMSLIAQELMSLAGIVGFTNRRYLKDESMIFEQELKKLLIERYSSEEMPLSNYSLKKSPVVQHIILANFSLDSNQRFINIPSIIQNKAFSDTVLELLHSTHERVKLLLKELRKSGNHSPQVKTVINKPTKEIDEAFKKSPLFDAIDVHMFDNNVKYFNDGVCPYCMKLLAKRPAQKGKCSDCGNTVLVKNSIFTGEKLIMTAADYDKMVKIREERTYRNWVRTMIANQGLDITQLANSVRVTGKSIEEMLIKSILNQAERHYRDSNLGLYRNSMMHAGNVYEKMGQPDKSLEMYLSVCFYDLRGCMNGTTKFDQKLAFLAPAVVGWVNSIGSELGLNKYTMKDRYIATVRNLKDRTTSSIIESTWKQLEETIYEND